MSAPLAGAFGAHGATWATIFISVGALAGLSTSLMASIFPLPRIIYAIASDGLLWPWLGSVSERFQTYVRRLSTCFQPANVRVPCVVTGCSLFAVP